MQPNSVGAIRSGANIKVLQNMLGHASAGLTLDRYGHLYDSDVDTVGRAINEAITVTCGHGVGTVPAVSRHPRAAVSLTCNNFGGRGRYRTADRWCVKPSPTVHRVSRGAIASRNAQLSGWVARTLCT